MVLNNTREEDVNYLSRVFRARDVFLQSTFFAPSEIDRKKEDFEDLHLHVDDAASFHKFRCLILDWELGSFRRPFAVADVISNSFSVLPWLYCFSSL